MTRSHDGDGQVRVPLRQVAPGAGDGAGAERCRLGVIVPSSNSVAEVDFAREAPPGVTIHTARALLEHTTAEAERRMLADHVPAAVRDLATVRPAVIAFACTSASSLLGSVGEEELIATSAAVAGAQVVSTSAAVAEVLRRIGGRVAIYTAYTDDLNEAIEGTLRQRGIEVTGITGLGYTDNFAIGMVRPDQIVTFVEESGIPDGTDAIFVSCTNLRAFEAMRALEERFGLPVVTSNSATLAVSLERAGFPLPLHAPAGSERR